MIAASRIRKSFRSGRGTVQALRDVSFVIADGTVAVFAGRSGSGKTTLLHILAGLEAPDAGTVECGGIAVSGLEGRRLSLFLRRHVGFVFQRGNLLSHLTVRENVAMPLVLNGVPRDETAARVNELLARVGLPDAGPAMPVELSGGELQRVSIARAVAHRPDLLLADEPTASLDSATGLLVTSLMIEMARESGCTVVVATHDPAVMRLAEVRFELKDGVLEKSKGGD